MGIRLAACVTLALALLALALTTPAQEAPRSKVDVPRDDVDKILLEEARRDKGRAIAHLEEKIRELDREHEDLVYQLINLRARLKRAAGGLAELDPSQAGRVRADAGNSSRRPKDQHFRPMPSPKTARERAEIIKKFEDQAALAAELEAEASSVVKHLREGLQAR